MTLLSFERRWAQAILECFAPPSFSGAGSGAARDGLVPVEGEVDYLRAFDVMCASSTAKARLGMRLAVWLFALAPIWSFVSLRTLAGFPIDRRAAFLDRLLTSKIYIVRELGLLLKLSASFALMASPAVRARCGYDRRGGVSPEPRATARGVEAALPTADGRRPRALPLLTPSFRPSHTGAA